MKKSLELSPIFFSLKLQHLLKKHGCLLVRSFVYSTGVGFFFTYYIYFRSMQSSLFKRRVFFSRKTLQSEKFLDFNKCNSIHVFFNKSLPQISKKFLFFSVINLNAKLVFSELKSFFLLFKKFLNQLFNRRFNLFIDLLKGIFLLIKGHFTVAGFLFILAQAFGFLHKRQHAKFLLFLKFLFQYLVELINSPVLGIKIVIRGRIGGKTMAKSSRILFGSVPDQTVGARVSFAKTHVYTIYGVFGIKLWMHLKNKNYVS